MSITVLIIDDSPTILALLGAILSREGYITESCPNGLEAMKLLKKKKHFDLVVSDETMPYVKGSEIADYMRSSEEYKNTPIIILSAEQNDAFFGKLVQEKIINCYYPKPFNIKPLLNMVNLLLRESNKVSAGGG